MVIKPCKKCIVFPCCSEKTKCPFLKEYIKTWEYLDIIGFTIFDLGIFALFIF